jgi:CBS domain-containing protein
MEAIGKMRGNSHELKISGIDELNIKHDSAMLESCNTSFQVHLQVKPSDFVRKYNIAQVLAAPVLAVAANSPMLLGKRLWSETRIALFEQSVDTRKTGEHLRDRSARVMFGNSWLSNSMIELYKEDITRFRVMLMCDNDEDALALIKKNKPPKLRALNIHNSTVYRWNRACYGISPNGKPHLRIENRVFPSGPSIIDEVANAAFWIGLMEGFEEVYTDVTRSFDFDHVRGNFIAAARNGINASFHWSDRRKESAHQLIREELIPIAKVGLEKHGLDEEEIDRYIGTIEVRNEVRQTGSQWMLNSFSNLQKKTSKEHILTAITSSIIKNQKSGKPIHKWELASEDDVNNWHPYSMLVEEFMTTDLFTVHQDDIPELVADILHWRKIKYLPVEDSRGNYKGLITFRELIKYYSKKSHVPVSKKVIVKDLMVADHPIIEPEENIQAALAMMREKKSDCLPVVKNQKLVGIITEGNFLNITGTILKNIENL